MGKPHGSGEKYGEIGPVRMGRFGCRVKRDWSEARRKVEQEGRCRVCHGLAVDPHHVVPRSRMGATADDPRNILPLCRFHHDEAHLGRLELLPLLSLEEQAYIVGLVGIEEARRRTIKA